MTRAYRGHKSLHGSLAVATSLGDVIYSSIHLPILPPRSPDIVVPSPPIKRVLRLNISQETLQRVTEKKREN